MKLERDIFGRFVPRYVSDPFDPRGWDEPLPYRALYLSGACDAPCIVDEIDFRWATQWLWSSTPDKHGHKFYATRSTRLDGRKGPQTRVFLHKEILLRCTPQPSRRHVIGDHLNGNSLDNRRSNLRWATPSQNARNRYGFVARQMQLKLEKRHVA